MPVITEKRLRHLEHAAQTGLELKEVFENKASKIVTLIAGGIKKYTIEKPAGVTDEQHQHYIDQIELLAASLESMPLKSENKNDSYH